ncbi:MAG: phage integrase N-terminal SAM-like domain-containing protein, partial [Acidobacteria bacterium]|nr:phage integrase N-terminal SAM-like domain-containing protein [Acidobacteriota bacterium]
VRPAQAVFLNLQFSGALTMSKLLEEVRDLIRTLHYSYRTEEAYLNWIRQYILFHGKRHPAEMGADQVTEFLTHLAVKRQVAASTQNQALAALLFLYKNVLKEELPWLKNVERAKRPARIPLVLTRAEVKRLLSQLGHQNWLQASLLYGAGLRLRECLSLRVKDLDFEYQQIAVRDAKGNKDRVTMLPASAADALKTQLANAKGLHLRDLADGWQSPFAICAGAKIPARRS